MTPTASIVLAVLILTPALIGALRDGRRNLLSLFGTLLGATLSGFWGEQWGLGLAERGIERASALLLVQLSLLLVGALAIGYGGAILLTPNRLPLMGRDRIAGAALGLLNGVLICSYMLRFIASTGEQRSAALLSSPLARALHDGLPLLWLLITLAMLVAIGYQLALRRKPRRAPVKAGAIGSLSEAERQALQQRLMERLKERGEGPPGPQGKI